MTVFPDESDTGAAIRLIALVLVLAGVLVVAVCVGVLFWIGIA